MSEAEIIIGRPMVSLSKRNNCNYNTALLQQIGNIMRSSKRVIQVFKNIIAVYNIKTFLKLCRSIAEIF